MQNTYTNSNAPCMVLKPWISEPTSCEGTAGSMAKITSKTMNSNVI